VRDNALARRQAKTSVIPPGVDAAMFSPDLAYPSGKGILFVGPLDTSYRWKGVDTLWDAFTHVQASVPDATLTLIGAGDRVEEFRAKAQAMQGKRRGSAAAAVRVLGRLPDAELAQEYRNASVLVLPSVTDAESFGMVLAEANACARPVIGSDVGGIPGFVRDGDNGLLATPGDAHDLAAKVTQLLRDPDEAAAMGKRGRQRVLRDHDWQALTQRTEEVLRAAAEG
jgi:glycosyltransferase involved in cell wall biosynthesis